MMNPSDILPSECWEVVFDKVKEPQDWLNLYRSSSYFQEVVGEKRCSALFQQVFPQVFDYLGKRPAEILGHRLVSQSWKAAVDKVLENSDSSSKSGFVRRQLERAYNFQNSARISCFLERFEAHSGNPFVGRVASLKYVYSSSVRRPQPQILAEYIFLATNLLDKFGSHIKTLRTEFNRTSFDACATQLASNLQLSPNLHSLIVLCPDNFPNNRGEMPIQYVERGPLPLLSSLKYISLSGVGESHGLLDLRNAVVRLSCSPSSLESVETTRVPSELLPFPHVKSAKVSLLWMGDYINLTRTQWPLSKLNVDYYYDASVQFEPLFECIEHFKATLTSLQIMRRNALLSHDPPFNLKFDLPCLKKLKIGFELVHKEISLEFLTNLPNLEVLVIFSTLNVLRGTGPGADYCQGFIDNVQREVGRLGLWETEVAGVPKLAKICLMGPFFNKRLENGEFPTFMMRHVATRSMKEFQRQENQKEIWTNF